jgi:hypothetical protein
MRLIHALHRKNGASAMRPIQNAATHTQSTGRLISVQAKPPPFRHRALTKI